MSGLRCRLERRALLHRLSLGVNGHDDAVLVAFDVYDAVLLVYRDLKLLVLVGHSHGVAADSHNAVAHAGLCLCRFLEIDVRVGRQLAWRECCLLYAQRYLHACLRQEIRNAFLC